MVVANMKCMDRLDLRRIEFVQKNDKGAVVDLTLNIHPTDPCDSQAGGAELPERRSPVQQRVAGNGHPQRTSGQMVLERPSRQRAAEIEVQAIVST